MKRTTAIEVAHVSVNEGRSVGRKKSTSRKPCPEPETLQRSIAPGSFESCDLDLPLPEKTWNNFLLNAKENELASR
jgi:hypothetical protein